MRDYREVDFRGFADMKAVFLDRDGVINRKPTDGQYVTTWRHFEFLLDVERAIRLLNERGFVVIVVTNQRGISLGHMTEEEVIHIHRKMLKLLHGAKARIDAVYYCPHDYGKCDCRKPGVGLFLQAKNDLPLIEFGHSFVVGDSPSDIESGHRLGCKTILITNGDGKTGQHGAHQPTHVASSLLEAVEKYIP